MIDPAGDKFSLESTSTILDDAIYVTEVDDAGGGSGTSLPVDDAGFFFSEEKWLLDDHENQVRSDLIFVDSAGTANDFAEFITNINYTSTPNTLTLAASHTWDDDADVYICPNGVCWSGTGPEIGARERGSLTRDPVTHIGSSIPEQRRPYFWQVLRHLTAWIGLRGGLIRAYTISWICPTMPFYRMDTTSLDFGLG
jgi:hypothetical protein